MKVNIWSVIAGFAKYYGMSFKDVLDMSYQNLLMYSAVISSNSGGKKGDEFTGSVEQLAKYMGRLS